MTKATYLAIDLETTGLVPAEGSILEVAALVLDVDFNVLETYQAVLPFTTADRELTIISPVVQKMHTENGLWEECAAVPYNQKFEVPKHLISVIDTYTWTEKRPVLVGTNVDNFDRRWIEHHWHRVGNKLHYRSCDATTAKRLACGAGGECWLPGQEGVAHRAMGDIMYSCAVLKAVQDRLKLVLATGAA